MIYEMALLLFTPSQIAINIEVDEQDFKDEVDTPGTVAHVTYFRGFLANMIDTRRQMIKAAHNGSTPQLDQVNKLIIQTSKALKYE